jgi:hypothetical protein
VSSVIVTRELVAGDTLMGTDNGCAPTSKIVRLRDTLYGYVGEPSRALQFLRWIKDGARGEKPDFSAADDDEDEEFEVVQVSRAQGIILWDQRMEPVPIHANYYAIGSGGSFALGALDWAMRRNQKVTSEDVAEALQIAADRDPNTRGPFEFLKLDAPQKKTRKNVQPRTANRRSARS